MTSFFKPFRNRDNFAKWLLLHFEPATNVFLTVFEWLYIGQKPAEYHLLDVLQSKTKLNKGEKSKLEKLRDGLINLSQFDVSFLFLLIKVTCNVADKNDDIWGINCPHDKTQELEHLLYKLKQGRNESVHSYDDLKELTDLEVYKKSNDMIKLLTSIINLAGVRAGIDPGTIQKVINITKQTVERISEGEDHDAKLKPYIHELIKEDLKRIYESDLKNSFENELRGYSKPTLILHTEHGNEEQPLKNLLSNFDYENIVTLVGGAGEGKTSLIKFLFYNWITNNENLFDNLPKYDVVFMIQSRYVRTRSISEFLENQLHKAIYCFTTTNSFRKQIKPSNVLWIMDGYDERTSESKELLQEISENTSKTHHLLISVRPSFLEILKNENKIENLCYLYFEKFNITLAEEILKKLFLDDGKVDEIKNKYLEMISSSSDSLNNPLMLKLFAENYSESKIGNSITGLYKLDVENKLHNLEKRIERKSDLTEDDLKMNIRDWFDFLCFQSYQLILNQTLGFVDTNAETKLKRQANLNYLIPLECISTFFLTKELQGLGKSFSHLTQQYFFAALYIMKALKGEITYKGDENYILPKKRPGPLKLHYKEVLKFWITIETEEETINQSISFLIKALFCIETRWYFEEITEFLIASNNNDKLTQEIAQNLTENEWIVGLETYKTAVKLLHYTAPKYILFNVNERVELDSKDLHNKIKIVSKAAMTKKDLLVEIQCFHNSHFYIGSNKSSDEFVSILTDKNIKLKRLTGTLHDCRLIRELFEDIEYLKLRITSEDAFLNFLNILREKNCESITILLIVLDFQFIKHGKNFVKFPKALRKFTQLYFPHVKKSNFTFLINVLKTLNSSYMEKLPIYLVEKSPFKKIYIKNNDLTDYEKTTIQSSFSEMANIIFVESKKDLSRLKQLPNLFNIFSKKRDEQIIRTRFYTISFLICIFAIFLVIMFNY